MNTLTKYEKTRILGTRAEQISLGSSPTIDVSNLNDKSPINIAREEMRREKIPLTVIRPLPNGDKKKIKIYKEEEVKED